MTPTLPPLSPLFFQVRRRAATKFLETGHRVKVTVQFRGREQAHADLIGSELLRQMAADVAGVAVADGPVKREGPRLLKFLRPKAEK